MALWVGIDPGKKGGIASIDAYGNLEVFELHGDASIFHEWSMSRAIKHVYLEKAQSMPKQGVTSMFNYANNYGQLQGVMIGCDIPFTLIRPTEWQKVMFVGSAKMAGKKKRDPKERALEVANRIFCKKKSFWLPSLRSKKPHDGLIDAALLAEACRRMVG